MRNPYDDAAFAQAWSELHDARTYFPTRNAIGPVDGASDAELIAAYKASV